MLYSNRLATSTVMVRRDLPLRFCPGKRYAEDYLLWLQILLEGYPGARLQCDLAYFFKAPYGEGGLSAHLGRAEGGELDTYVRLARQGHVSWWLLAVLVPSSVAKFLRRLVLSLVFRCWEPLRNCRTRELLGGGTDESSLHRRESAVGHRPPRGSGG